MSSAEYPWVAWPYHPAYRRQESAAAADINPATGQPLDVGQHDLEESGAAKKSAGFFHKGLLQALESDHRAGGNLPEVKVVGNGHSHSRSSRFLRRLALMILQSRRTAGVSRVSGYASGVEGTCI